ncbi:hypothetical protein [Deinococcus multiflagellatus]|nr:hypothetical protein [Deinococcus multiflagellatus]MBZ9712020.1 hypothetical protein [Deinococcus multiflagellatus]
MPTSHTIRAGLLALLGGGLLLPAAGQSPEPDPALLRAAATLYATAQVGAVVRDWCLKVAPAQRATTEQGYAAWRAAAGLPGIEAYLQRHAAAQLPALRAPAEERRAQLYAELDRASQNPAADCRTIQAQLTEQVNLATLNPQEYALTQALRRGPAAPVTPPPAVSSASGDGGPFITGTAFSPLARAGVQALLGKAGGQPPYRGGGPLKTGTYGCVMQQTNDFETLLSLTSYTLTLYSDQGVRVTDQQYRSQSSGAVSPLKNLEGTYRYQPATGELSAQADFANDDLTELLGPNGRYDGVGDDEPLYNIFRVLTDRSGTPMIYGQQAYGYRDGRVTVCRYAGAAQGTSPVAQARQAAQAEAERLNRYRLKSNAGPTLAQIEGLLHTYENEYVGINVLGRETTILLLKDGTAYLNLRWSPNDLDVAASRRGEPKAWTKWRRQGGGYELLEGGRWVPSKGTLGYPASKNEAISGSYRFFSAYTSGTLMNGATASSEDTYRFGPGQQFTRLGHSGVAGTLNTGAAVTTGAASGPSTRAGGTYTFSGYTLELRRGVEVTRTYAFYWSRDKKNLNIGGTTYTRE